MTRVIAGTHKGRRLAVPAGTATRPTSDRAREGLFSSLLSLLDVEGARVLDLYAGSGALGLEALSRGAFRATLVEQDPAAAAVVRANLAALALEADVVEADVEVFLRRSPERVDLALLDPPYEVAVEPVLELLLPWLAPEAIVVVERRTRGQAPLPPDGLTLRRDRRYGEATLWYFRAT
ncbi:MAG: 16S rRNA (guanine(966)-N(2))-methyltransferase RsmD [Actinomycetota bacterium]|nr:16S rRNA (guanine(966)-N(2))-methyltransferase RsmD [Actinomycetota bacterium]